MRASMNTAKTAGFRVAIVVALLATAGCFSDPRFKPTFRLTGRLLYDGQPAGGATVALVPIDPNAPPDPWVRARGIADDDGSFTVTTYRTGDGVPNGEYAILAYWFPPGPVDATAVNKLPARYSTLEGSPARVVVNSAPVDVGTIVLTP